MILTFAGVVTQITFHEAIVRILKRRHVEVWEKLTRRRWLARSAVVKFARTRGDRILNDPELTAKTRLFVRIYWATLGGWVLYVATLIFSWR